MALATSARQALWYINGLSQLGFTIPVKLKADNTSSINISKNLINNLKTKHIDVSSYFTREYLICKSFTLSYVPTGRNLADIMTKGLPFVLHQRYT